jgi:hypothetical protein
VILYNVYAMCILFWHFRRYVIIRQTYLTRGARPRRRSGRAQHGRGSGGCAHAGSPL